MPDTEGTLGPVTEGSSTTEPMPYPTCGDGVLDPGEQCDDNNLYPYDACTDSCMEAFCGDFVVEDNVEQCDDGKNGMEDDGCLDDCTLPVCGDGIWDMTEECDFGDNEDEDGCEHDCRETEKIIFVSSKLSNGKMGGLLGADEACNMLAMTAENGPLPGTYMAWLSTDDESPVTRMSPSEYRYVRSDRTIIVESWTELVNGTPFAPIDLNEHGKKHPGVNPIPVGCGWSAVHTNTLVSGKGYMLDTDCGGWNSESGETLAGSIALGEVGWTQHCESMDCATFAPIYCVQQAPL